MRILIVDDDVDFADSLALALDGRGHQIEIAHSGEEAISKCSSSSFDVTLMDVKLPGINGVESFKQIRGMKPDARVIMMTGFSVDQLLKEAVDQGAYGVLHKPLNLDELITILKAQEPQIVLIADDDEEFSAAMREVLQHHGFTVFNALTGKQALQVLDSQRIDVLILDLRMPELSGIDVFFEQNQRGTPVATVIVTAFADEHAAEIKRMLASSAKQVFRKPCDPRDLISTVAQLVTASRSNHHEC